MGTIPIEEKENQRNIFQRTGIYRRFALLLATENRKVYHYYNVVVWSVCVVPVHVPLLF